MKWTAVAQSDIKITFLSVIKMMMRHFATTASYDRLFRRVKLAQTVSQLYFSTGYPMRLSVLVELSPLPLWPLKSLFWSEGDGTMVNS